MLLAACSQPSEVQKVEVSRVEVAKPAPIVPAIPAFKAEAVQWIDVNPETVQGEFERLGREGKKPRLIAVDENGYRSMLKNLAEAQSVIEKQKVVIAIYESSYAR